MILSELVSGHFCGLESRMYNKWMQLPWRHSLVSALHILNPHCFGEEHFGFSERDVEIFGSEGGVLSYELMHSLDLCTVGGQCTDKIISPKWQTNKITEFLFFQNWSSNFLDGLLVQLITLQPYYWSENWITNAPSIRIAAKAASLGIPSPLSSHNSNFNP